MSNIHGISITINTQIWILCCEVLSIIMWIKIILLHTEYLLITLPFSGQEQSDADWLVIEDTVSVVTIILEIVVTAKTALVTAPYKYDHMHACINM